MRAFPRILIALLLTWLLAGSVRADLTGDIQGTVIDSSGAVVAGAKITIKNRSNGATRVVYPGDSGDFSAPQLEIGDYQITVEKDGFKSFNQDVVVRSGEKTRVDVHMEIGKVNETVVVESGAIPTLDVATAQVSDSISSQEALALPNQARDPVAYATLSPGTVPVTKDNPFLGTGSFNSNGSRGRANNITLDGVTASDISTTGESGAAFTQDTVQEVKVITNNFDAEFGRNSGSQVQIITKSGTNSYHGSAYWYHQNSALGNARDYFDTTGGPTPLIQSQGGVTFGAPIYKNHTFFYGNWEVQRTRGAGSTVSANVLTTAEAAGITDPTDLTLFQNNGSPSSDSGTITNSATNQLNGNTWSLRVDQVLRGGKDTLFVRYGQSPSVAISPGLTFIGTNLAGFGASSTATPRDLNIGYTAAISNSLVNSFRFGFGRVNPQFPANSPFPPGPQIIILGLDSFGESDIIPQGRTQNTFQYLDTLSWTHGRHTIKVGADVNRYQAPSFCRCAEIRCHRLRRRSQFPDRQPARVHSIYRQHSPSQFRARSLLFCSGRLPHHRHPHPERGLPSGIVRRRLRRRQPDFQPRSQEHHAAWRARHRTSRRHRLGRHCFSSQLESRCSSTTAPAAETNCALPA